VKGKVFASGKVVLEAKSTFHGELKTSKLVIDEGALFEGVCSMTDDGKLLALPEGVNPPDRVRAPERLAARQ
jgi:cytoskeletal protein CcmA (bactofilin family)